MDIRYAMGAALAAGFFVAMPVSAQDQGFTRLDKNNDGNIDTTEAAAWPWLQQNFSTYDADHNGKLGKDEFAAAVNAARAARAAGTPAAAGATSATSSAYAQFDTLDKNNDGKLDPTEVAALPWLQQGFSTYDTNHDGTLGKDEFSAALSAHGPGAAGATASSSSSAQFDSLDKNNDGKLDPTEVQALPWLQQGFSTYDTNHDGTLGKDEFSAAVTAHGPQ